MKTFSKPLQKPSDGKFKNVSNDYSSIGKIYRERLSGSRFPFKQNPAPVPDCTYCGSRYTPEKGYVDCSGACYF